MKRLHELSNNDLHEWLEARKEAGRDEYSNKHISRYNLVDVVEELLDAGNILELFQDRMKKDQVEFDLELFHEINEDLEVLVHKIQELDEGIPDISCSDEEGGERIWWGDE